MSDNEDDTLSIDSEDDFEDDSSASSFKKQAVLWYWSAASMYSFSGKRLKRDRGTSGKKYIMQTLSGHPGVCRELYQLSPDNFYILCDELRVRGLECKGDIIIEEKVAMFLQLVGHGAVIRVIANEFQHSEETVWRSIREVAHHVLLMMPDYIKMPNANTPRHPKLLEGSAYHPFKDALGAIDGTHIEEYPDPDEDYKERWRCRKGFLSQNVMAAVDFDEKFLAVNVGWEGSAHDQTILRRAVEDGFFTVPEGRYFLVDQGYANTYRFISPYRTGIYHLASFYKRPLQNRFRIPEDTFNYKHAQLRNSVEKAFGKLKGRFKICKTMHRFKYDFQVDIVLACCALHNFIKRYQYLQGAPDDEYYEEDDDETTNVYVAPAEGGTDAQRGKVLRDNIRDQLWAAR